MLKILWDEGFKDIYKKKIRDNPVLKEKFWFAVELFSKDPFNSKLRTHKLSGKLKELWAFSVAYDCRVIFKFLDENKVFLIDIVGHDEIY